ncbi:hypothetical protein ACVWZW_005882 [Bradyrhizobium sp. F1.13.4]
MIGKFRRRHPIAVTKSIKHLPVMLIERRPAPFQLTDVLTYRFKRVFGFHGRLFAIAWFTISYGSGTTGNLF